MSYPVTVSILGPVALALAAAFSGAAIYILASEQPARLLLDDGALLRQWQAAIGPATAMQASLVVLTTLAALVAWWLTGTRLWLVGAALMLANLPFTLLVIAPVNAELQGMAAEQAGAARALIQRWGELHQIRVAFGLLATGCLGWALARS
ncbi:DUF1772 domain-containing protein [Bosea sp. (in: a-proteobacteria)]|jgi:hypothetical protein|uniref:DUF1772 domain-containing protein n=1 Tax=Bosea sp. (in: a-proteobacteria) TaxID=1871050 RepID=UPI003F72C19C